MIQWDRIDNARNKDYFHFERTFPRACLGVYPVLIRGDNTPRSCHVEMFDQSRWRFLTDATRTSLMYNAIGW